MSDDPRLNAPPCLSHIHGEARRRELYARHNASTAAYMRRFCEQAVRPTLFQRMREALRG